MEQNTDQNDQQNRPNDADPQKMNMDPSMESMDKPEPEMTPVSPEPIPTPPPIPESNPMSTNESAPNDPDPTPAPMTTPGIAPIQAQQSLDGIGGWLLAVIVVSALGGIYQALAFVMAISLGFSDINAIVNVIMSPIAAIAFIASIILIMMRKKIAITFTILALVVTLLNSIANVALNLNKSTLTMLIGVVVAELIIIGLCVPYLRASKRVKQTLIK